VSGTDLLEFVTPWLGSIQWICESPYRPEHVRKNWFVAIRLIPVGTVDSADVEPRDINWKAVKASGPGGQHVNKTNTAVQAIHRPTGIKATSAEERSQLANRKRALEKIRVTIASRNEGEKQKEAQRQWIAHRELVRGNPVKTFVGREFTER
jgi:peptide chain release factor